MESKAPCGGIIVLDNTGSKVVIVKTHAGNLGFTKGKREKGETLLQCAIRETTEESGLTLEQIRIIPISEPIIEVNKRGNVSVEYFLAAAKATMPPVLQCSPEELATVTWMPVEAAMRHEKLRERRKHLLQAAVALFKNT
jgi:8-oxo-dGTP diphosphatase